MQTHLDPISKSRISQWVTQTNLHSPPASPSSPTHLKPHLVGTRQRRHGLLPAQRRPRKSSTSSRSTIRLPTPKRRQSGAHDGEYEHPALERSRQESYRQQPQYPSGSSSSPYSSPNGSFGSGGTGSFAGAGSTAYPAIVLLISCFALAALLPSLLIVVIFAVFLTLAPGYETIQADQSVPLHRKPSALTLRSNEDLREREGYGSTSPEDLPPRKQPKKRVTF